MTPAAHKRSGRRVAPERRSPARASYPPPRPVWLSVPPGGARGPGWNRLPPGLLWATWDLSELADPSSYAPSAPLPNSFSASLEGNPRGVCCRHPPISYPGGLKPVEFPTHQGRRELWQKPRFPPALLDPANASCMT